MSGKPTVATLDYRVGRVEADVKEIKTDVKRMASDGMVSGQIRKTAVAVASAAGTSLAAALLLVANRILGGG